MLSVLIDTPAFECVTESKNGKVSLYGGGMWLVLCQKSKGFPHWDILDTDSAYVNIKGSRILQE